jgi:hypothetical protein
MGSAASVSAPNSALPANSTSPFEISPSVDEVDVFLRRLGHFDIARVLKSHNVDGAKLKSFGDSSSFLAYLSSLSSSLSSLGRDVTDEESASLRHYFEAVLHNDPSLLQCGHPYFNCWEGVYLCMDCWYKLNPQIPEDASRIAEQVKNVV